MASLDQIRRSLSEAKRPEKVARLRARLARMGEEVRPPAPSKRERLAKLHVNVGPQELQVAVSHEPTPKVRAQRTHPTDTFTVKNVFSVMGRDRAVEFAGRILQYAERSRGTKPKRVMVRDLLPSSNDGIGLPGRRRQAVADVVICPVCRRGFLAKRADARTCSPKCRQALHRKHAARTAR